MVVGDCGGGATRDTAGAGSCGGNGDVGWLLSIILMYSIGPEATLVNTDVEYWLHEKVFCVEQQSGSYK